VNHVNRFGVDDQKKREQEANQAVLRCIEDLGYRVRDLTKNLRHQLNGGGDYKLFGKDTLKLGWRWMVSSEIKNDFRAAETGNFFLEELSNAEKGVKGCILASRSPVFCFHIPPLEQMILVRTREFQDWFRWNFERLPQRTAWSIGWKRYGRLISVKPLVHELKDNGHYVKWISYAERKDS